MAADIKGVLPTNPTMQEIVAAMKQYEIGLANSVAHMYPLSVIPVFDYMIHKENEVGNIRMIARGTESGLDRETMKTLLVM
jgi:V/A-type H+-transporting ATPase subunit C